MKQRTGTVQGLRIALLILCILVSVKAQAHDIWIEKEGEVYVLLYGHTGVSHEGVVRIEYSPDNVLQVECFDETGNKFDAEVNQVYPVRICAECSVLCVLTSSGYWTKTPFGTKNLPRNEAISPLSSWLSYESVKRIDAWTEKLSVPLTGDLELTPLRNPLELSRGKKVRLLVTLNGEPLSSVPVSYEGKTRGQTDEQGRINIRLRHGGMQLIQTSYTTPADSEKADEIIHTATLVFEIASEK